MEPGWVPPEIDTTQANIARVYDYWLGGSHNFRADQDVARAMIAVDPNIRAMMRANRAFLGRAVRYLVRKAGIRQFLDIGSGIPTEQNVHEVAQAAASGSRVVYVDNNEVAVAHSRLMLEDNPDATVIQADLRSRPRSSPTRKPSCSSISPSPWRCSCWRCCISSRTGGPRADPRDPAQRGLPGSCLVICHACRDVRPDTADNATTVYNSRVAANLRVRTRDEIAALFDGFTLVEPGLVWIPEWRPDSPADVPENPEQFWALVGVARRDA